MAQLRWLHICEKALIERDTHSVSLIRIVERVRVPRPTPGPSPEQPIVVPFSFSIAQRWERTADRAETLTVRVRLLNSSGKQFAQGESTIDLATHPAAHSIINVPGFPLGPPGPISVQVQTSADGKRWRTVGKTMFALEFLDEKT